MYQDVFEHTHTHTELLIVARKLYVRVTQLPLLSESGFLDFRLLRTLTGAKHAK